MALVDYFLKIDGCPGESMDAKHKDEIHILSFSFGASQSGTMAFGGGGGAGKVQMQDFHFMMNVNKASPVLFQKCATGEHIPKATLTARKATGDDRSEYRAEERVSDHRKHARHAGRWTCGQRGRVIVSIPERAPA